MDNELWKPVFGFEGWYSVSSLGRIRRDCEGRRTFAGAILRPTAASGTCKGYLQVTLFRERTRHARRVHRIVAEAFIGPCPDGLQVNHKNGNKQDNRIENLEYVTAQENCLLATRVTGANVGKPPLKRGSDNVTAKLTELQIVEIRKALANSETGVSIAARFGVTVSTISLIKRGKIWRHVD